MKELKHFGLLALLTAFYFVTTYFMVAALAPGYALRLAFWIAAAAIVAYLVLFFARLDGPTKIMTVLIFFPLNCILVGIIWWLMRLLGVWTPIR